jgi:prevent-host-death family protein
MIDLRDIVPLTDFQRNAKTLKKKMQKSGKPVILTVNGRADLVVQDVKSYQKMLEKLELLSEFTRAEAEIAEGKVTPASKVFLDLERKHGIHG